MIYTIRAEHDDETGYWFVSDSDVPGLVTEAPTRDALLAKLRVMVPELLELNASLLPEPVSGVEIEWISRSKERLELAA
jgi:predicted RNase H-like HicB family nuclease